MKDVSHTVHVSQTEIARAGKVRHDGRGMWITMATREKILIQKHASA